MNETPVTKLGDVALEGPSPFGWTLRYGVDPSTELYTVTVDCANAIVESGIGYDNPKALEINGPRAVYRYERLYVLEVLPANKPYLRRLRLADGRVWWPYEWIKVDFNVIRAGGDRFLVDAQGPPSKAISDPRLIYGPHSLNPFSPTPGGEKWTALDALEHLLGSPAPDGLGEPVIRDLDPSHEGAELEDPAIDLPGDAAIELMLGYLSGVNIYQSMAGGMVITDTRSRRGEEIAEATRDGRLKTGPESLEVDRSHLLPSKVVNLFTTEAEVRFNFVESEGSAVQLRDIDDPILVNVGRVTEQQLSVGGELLARGSYARIEDLFAAWGAFGNTNTALSITIMRQLLLEHNGALIEDRWGRDAAGNRDKVNSERAAEAVRSWRKLYRIAPTFFDRLESISASRAAIVNTEIPTRARADVYCDYMRRPSLRGALFAGQFAGVAAGVAVEAYSGGGIDGATEAPAIVKIDDALTGIIEIIPQRDPDGWYDFTVLGYPTDGQVPTIGSGADSNRVGNQVFADWSSIDLRSQFHLAVVMSVTPLTPQNRTRLYAIEVEIPEGKGPPLYSRVSPALATARVAYSDATQALVVDAIKGLASWSDVPREQLANADILDDIAVANTARVADLFRTRTYGGHDIDLAPDIEPTGSLSSVRHVMARGVTATQLRFEPDRQFTDTLRYLPKAARQFVQRSLIGRQTRLAP